MKWLSLILLILIFTNCSNRYEKEEFIALQDVINDYLTTKDLYNYLNPPPPPPPFGVKNYHPVQRKVNIDSLKLKVFISAGSAPIFQIKEDEPGFFDFSPH